MPKETLDIAEDIIDETIDLIDGEPTPKEKALTVLENSPTLIEDKDEVVSVASLTELVNEVKEVKAQNLVLISKLTAIEKAMALDLVVPEVAIVSDYQKKLNDFNF